MTRPSLPEELLSQVEDGHRPLLERAAGTAFAPPFMASFALDDPWLERSDPAGSSGSDAFLVDAARNGAHDAPATAYEARLLAPGGMHAGSVRFELSDGASVLAYTAAVPRVLLLTRVAAAAWYPALHLRTADGQVIVGLVSGQGQIRRGRQGLPDDLFEALRQAMAAGRAVVEAETSIGPATGPVVPA